VSGIGYSSGGMLGLYVFWQATPAIFSWPLFRGKTCEYL
jgi:hypothetical protein